MTFHQHWRYDEVSVRLSHQIEAGWREFPGVMACNIIISLNLMATSTPPWSAACLSGLEAHCWSFPLGLEMDRRGWKVWKRNGKVQIYIRMMADWETEQGNSEYCNKRKDGRWKRVPDNSYYLPPASSKRHCHRLVAATTWDSNRRRATWKREFQSYRMASEFILLPDIISGILLR